MRSVNPFLFRRLVGPSGLGLLLVLATACGSTRPLTVPPALTGGGCAPWSAADSVAAAPRPALQMAGLDTTLTHRFSAASLHTAHAFWLLPPLAAYAQARRQYRRQPTLAGRVAVLEHRQQLSQRLTQAQLEVATVASQLDCQEEQADQLAGFMANRASEAETRLTAASIVVGAVGSVAVGALFFNNKGGKADELIGIGTGLAGAGLGLRILRNARRPPTVLVAHARNPLGAVWAGDNAAGLFPPAVWYYLTQPHPAAPGQPPVLERLRADWTRYGQLGPENSKERTRLTQLFFGAGGAYTAAELGTRADMHDELESQVNLLQRDLARLSRELVDF